jgi:hypothetical protein
MKKLKMLGFVLMAVMTIIGIVWAADDTSSKYASGTTSGIILFDSIPNNGWSVKAVNADSDLATAKVTFQGRLLNTPVAKTTSNALSTATIIQLSSTTGISTNDLLYFKPTAIPGSGFVVTAALVTATSVTLQSPGLVTNTLSGDFVCEIGTLAAIPTGPTNTSPLNLDGEALVQTQGNSPLRAVVNGTASCEVSVSATKVER